MFIVNCILSLLKTLTTDKKFCEINGGASFRWSFAPLSAWGSIESTTILNTQFSNNARDFRPVNKGPWTMNSKDNLGST